MLSQILFILLLIAGAGLFAWNFRKVIRNIQIGRDVSRNDQPGKRWMVMLKVAFGQTKMAKRPIPFLLHLVVYLGFVIINIEVIEIVIDGIFGTHRVLSFMGGSYNFLIGSFEFLAAGVWLACVIFLIRRNVLKLKRFTGVEMKSWPKSDANYILFTEILLMSAFLIMNAADAKLQSIGFGHYVTAGSFPISSFIQNWLPSNPESLVMIERASWWFHIVGIFAFLNYLPYSKHFHILFAFPNTWYSKLQPKGEFSNMQSVTNEVKAMLDPSFVPEPAAAGRFGAKDVQDLTKVNLLNAYTCTECGRCTSVCPANITGKLLSPRKIMMDTRDRMEEVGRNIDKHGKDYDDGKSLIDNYITREEIWACTSCNACTEACPVNIDPLEIITELRRYAVMEESQSPASINAMFGNVENNGAPWKYAPSDRFNWSETQNN
ncbi:4Fe-4S dicluster domain-containing protein [Pedobacter flavus]|uniref:4Fe-4S dicluster domain-containing protein n=1 Tax=Pedobacter flavus TaxID=3113906 RepID=A0ABU7H1E2_9SPHI|nr:4Fe-4S dicluster domain-containing protein [Pedobacter sp. VNH31]MEE1885074.1 4Fe-4S dicluster domain-containing protein [Pedobacter sp. VNH31]